MGRLKNWVLCSLILPSQYSLEGAHGAKRVLTNNKHSKRDETNYGLLQIVSEPIPVPTESPPEDGICHTQSSTSLLSLDSGRSSSISEDSNSETDEFWIPHCFVKSKTKEFVGCTSMSEAFHRLDLARAVTDVRRFNYICKVVQILVQEKLQNLSATARKSLLSILTAIALRSSLEDVHQNTVRELVNKFSSSLESYTSSHVCGSPQLVNRHQYTAIGLLEMVSDRQPRVEADAVEEGTTFFDLPREVMTMVLRRLPDHESLLETAKAHDALQAMIDGEQLIWKSLCEFHFQPYQIAQKRVDAKTWRQTFFDLKKYFGVREVYADVIHICCACKALFWTTFGHPCVRDEEAPSVRVTPQQFVDMLIYL